MDTHANEQQISDGVEGPGATLSNQERPRASAAKPRGVVVQAWLGSSNQDAGERSAASHRSGARRRQRRASDGVGGPGRKSATEKSRERAQRSEPPRSRSSERGQADRIKMRASAAQRATGAERGGVSAERATV